MFFKTKKYAVIERTKERQSAVTPITNSFYANAVEEAFSTKSENVPKWPMILSSEETRCAYKAYAKEFITSKKRFSTRRKERQSHGSWAYSQPL